MALTCVFHAAQAADAGKIIFVAGKASVGGQPALDGAPVREGQMLSTGADGFLYIKTVDSGLFILRPNTQARIAAYQVDEKNPAKTQVKFELLSGVARSKSGNAVKQARQNFRFNTPVAAIGVRGTDFTVFTDNDTSRVAVISGAIVMSGFGGACMPGGAGPCDGDASRELSASQRGLLLQVQRGQVTPQLLQGSPLSPDQVSPPRADEPLARAAGAGGGASAAGLPNLDAQKTVDLVKVVDPAPPSPPPVKDVPPVPVPPPAQPAPPVVVVPPAPPVTPVPPIEAAIVLPARDIVWGRWQVVAGRPPDFNLPQAMDQSELIKTNGNYALLRSRGTDDFVMPNNGSIGFQLKGGEAFIYTDYTPTYRIETPASLTNGMLTVDFGKQSFETSIGITSGAESFKLSGSGTVGADGQLNGSMGSSQINVLNLNGLLSRQNGGSAAYIFTSRLDEKRSANGVTYWQQTPH
ncbi:FecR family protein [Massilia aerilata]|uniref:FecR domain-containing protein n=1 Tax=Massilia aerilata TaxID=453817 RepID=A0ABW0S493_9BURK